MIIKTDSHESFDLWEQMETHWKYKIFWDRCRNDIFFLIIKSYKYIKNIHIHGIIIKQDDNEDI